MDVANQTALVTGAGHRIGRAIALGLADAGAIVAVHYLSSADAAVETVEMVRSSGGRAQAFKADLSDASECESLAKAVSTELGEISVLVNNASLFSRNVLQDTTVADWDRYFAVNVRAPFLLAKSMAASLPVGRTGKIISLGDWRTARKNRFAYGASKAALSGLTRSLAVALAPAFQVNEVALGAVLPPVDTEGGPISGQTDRGDIPARRNGTLNEVVGAVMSLIENDYITGERIHVDGGRHIR